MNDTEERAIQTHQPCPDCGSRDALAIYPTHNYCYSCEKRTNHDGFEASEVGGRLAEEFYRVDYGAIPARSITEETARFWSYGYADYHGKRTHCAQYLDDNRKVVAQKFRTRDKQFPWINRRDFTGLYGQWLWRRGGKQVVITEGEIDAMSVSQVQNHKWPVVSVCDGGGKNAVNNIKEAYEWLASFEKIILFFDNDEKGRASVDLIKKLLPVGKVYIAFTPEGYKDPNDLLVAGKGKAIIDAIWEAKQWVPAGIVTGSKILDRLRNRPPVVSYPYPDIMAELNRKVLGIRLGELDTWTSGTGMGKTTIIKALQNHFFHTTDFNQALIHLEEPMEDTGDDLIAYEVGRRFQVEAPGDGPEFRGTEDYRVAAERLFLATDSHGHHRFQLYDAFGSLEDDSLYQTIRYLAKACGCRVFWLDHLSILVSDGKEDDERKRIDSIMHNLKSLTVELNIYIGLISHLRKPPGNGKSFEQGAVPSLDDLRGSGGIKQLSNGVYAISRNQQDTNPVARNTSTITVLKCRKTGRTGTADHLTFEDDTGRLTRGVDPATLTDDFDDEPTASHEGY